MSSRFFLFLLAALGAAAFARADWTATPANQPTLITDENGIAIKVSCPWGKTTLTITGISTLNGQTDLDFTKPISDANAKAYTITAIGNSSLQNTSIQSIAFPTTLTSIGSNAMRGDTGLTSVDLSACTSLTKLETYAIYGTKVATLKLPTSLEIINDNFANGLSCLTSVTPTTLPNLTKLGTSAFNGAKFGGDWVLPKLATLSVNAFAGTKITSVDFSGGTVATVGGSAFDGCSSLTNAALPDTVTTISGNAFRSCTALERLTPFFPSGLVSIGDGAFWGDKKLQGNPTFPSTLTTVGGNTFRDCVKFTKLDFSGTRLTTIGTYTIYGTSVGELHFPPTIESIGSTFAWRLSCLTNMTPGYLPNLKTVDTKAFYEGPKFGGDLVLPKIKSFGDSAFGGTKITSVDMSGAPLTCIGSESVGGIFDGCSALTNVVLPATLQKIGGNAFRDCRALKTATPLLPSNVCYIGASAFGYAPIEGELVFHSKKVVFATGQNAFRSAQITLVDLSSATNAITLPNYAFYGNDKLKTVVLGRGPLTCDSQVFGGSTRPEAIYFPGDPPANDPPVNYMNSLVAKVYVPKGREDWTTYLSANWAVTNLKDAEKASFSEKWPGEKVPKQKIYVNGFGYGPWQYLCWWWPNGAPGLSILIK